MVILENGRQYISCMEASQRYNVHPVSIAKIAKGGTVTAFKTMGWMLDKIELEAKLSQKKNA